MRHGRFRRKKASEVPFLVVAVVTLAVGLSLVAAFFLLSTESSSIPVLIGVISEQGELRTKFSARKPPPPSPVIKSRKFESLEHGTVWSPGKVRETGHDRTAHGKKRGWKAGRKAGRRTGRRDRAEREGTVVQGLEHPAFPGTVDGDLGYANSPYTAANILTIYEQYHSVAAWPFLHSLGNVSSGGAGVQLFGQLEAAALGPDVVPVSADGSERKERISMKPYLADGMTSLSTESAFKGGGKSLLHRGLAQGGHSHIFRGLAQASDVVRANSTDVNAPTILSILRDSYYQNAVCEYGGMWAVSRLLPSPGMDRPFLGFLSWRAKAKGTSLSPTAMDALLKALVPKGNVLRKVALKKLAAMEAPRRNLKSTDDDGKEVMDMNTANHYGFRGGSKVNTNFQIFNDGFDFDDDYHRTNMPDSGIERHMPGPPFVSPPPPTPSPPPPPWSSWLWFLPRLSPKSLSQLPSPPLRSPRSPPPPPPPVHPLPVSEFSGDLLIFWADHGVGNPVAVDSNFYESCDAHHLAQCTLIFERVFTRLHKGAGLKSFNLPAMPPDGGAWAYMSYWTMSRESFRRYMEYSRMFFVVLDGLHYNLHHDYEICPLAGECGYCPPGTPSGYLSRHCWCFLLERLVNIWAYHTGMRMIHLHPVTGVLSEHHPPQNRKMWSDWFGAAPMAELARKFPALASEFTHGLPLYESLGGTIAPASSPCSPCSPSSPCSPCSPSSPSSPSSADANSADITADFP